jgi:hypothetical protein
VFAQAHRWLAECGQSLLKAFGVRVFVSVAPWRLEVTQSVRRTYINMIRFSRHKSHVGVVFVFSKTR